jgi:phage terminase small subunit
MPKLTPKQAKFVLEYLANGLNATKAAISAGYSDKTAESQRSRLLSNVKVAAAISDKSQITLGKLEFSVDRTLNEIARLAFFDVRKIFEADGSLKNIHTIDDDSAAAISGLEVTELFDPVQQKDGAEGEPQKHVFGLLKKVKLADKGSALDKLMRYHALYRDKIQHTGENGGPLVFTLTRVGDRNKDKTT